MTYETKVAITNPDKDLMKVRHEVPLEGTIENLPENMELWVVKKVNGKYHPDDGPIKISGGKWKSSAYVGNSAPGSDKGKSFVIHIVEVDPGQGGKEFRNYLKTAKQHGWPGINSIHDGEIRATTTVVRNDPIYSYIWHWVKGNLQNIAAALAILAAIWAAFKYIL